MKWISGFFITCFLFINCSATAEPSRLFDFDLTTTASVDQAVSIITKKLQSQSLEVLAVIDHQKNASNVGLSLRPTQLILFRHRRQEKLLTRYSNTVAIDLPFKILVYEDAEGKVKIKTNEIGYMLDRHELPLYHPRLSTLDQILNQFGKNKKGLVFIKSRQSVEDTIIKLRALLEAAGFFIALELESDKRKQYQPGTLLVFGNPNVGTLFMQNRQEIGIDLPQKYLVFEDSHGQVYIVYNDPYFIARRAGIQGLQTLQFNVATALARFATLGATP